METTKTSYLKPLLGLLRQKVDYVNNPIPTLPSHKVSQSTFIF